MNWRSWRSLLDLSFLRGAAPSHLSVGAVVYFLVIDFIDLVWFQQLSQLCETTLYSLLSATTADFRRVA